MFERDAHRQREEEVLEVRDMCRISVQVDFYLVKCECDIEQISPVRQITFSQGLTTDAYSVLMLYIDYSRPKRQIYSYICIHIKPHYTFR